jgi:hypothetical protein
MLQTTHQEVVAAVTPAAQSEEKANQAACVLDARTREWGFEIDYTTIGGPVPEFGSVVYTHGPAGPVKKAII